MHLHKHKTYSGVKRTSCVAHGALQHCCKKGEGLPPHRGGAVCSGHLILCWLIVDIIRLGPVELSSTHVTPLWHKLDTDAVQQQAHGSCPTCHLNAYLPASVTYRSITLHQMEVLPWH